MRCSKCGQEGHNRRNCSAEPGEVRDQAVIARIDQLTLEERIKIADAIKDAKRRIAPEGRGTIVEGNQRQLPYQPVNYLTEGNDES